MSIPVSPACEWIEGENTEKGIALKLLVNLGSSEKKVDVCAKTFILDGVVAAAPEDPISLNNFNFSLWLWIIDNFHIQLTKVPACVVSFYGKLWNSCPKLLCFQFQLGIPICLFRSVNFIFGNPKEVNWNTKFTKENTI